MKNENLKAAYKNNVRDLLAWLRELNSNGNVPHGDETIRQK